MQNESPTGALDDFQQEKGQWKGVSEMIYEGQSPRQRWEIHEYARQLDLYTKSTGHPTNRVLHVYREKPEGWQPFVQTANPRSREMTRQLGFRNDELWAGGSREFIGDCADCGCELWGYYDELPSEGDEEELKCLRCGGDTLSRWELIR